jgi:tRNA dimethylallyltransferase
LNLLNSKDLFIVGPTASGKSSFSIQLSQKLNLPIVNCDSLQFYSDLRIGTAYPSELDFKQAPHLLFGIAKAGDYFSAGEFIRQFSKLRLEQNQKTSPAINGEQKNSEAKPKHDINQGGFKDPYASFLIVGGSGFYIKALETGMEDIEVFTDEMKHKVSFLQDWTEVKKADHLKEIDPKVFEYIHVNDHYRIQRALEVYYSQGLKMSEINLQSKIQKHQTSHVKLGLYLERSELLKRVDTRVVQMLSMGLIEEVQNLLKLGLKDWKPLQSVGYKEVMMYLEGLLPKEQLKDLIVQNTMYLAKRQMTWFRADQKVSWFHAENELDKAMIWASDFLNR